MSKATDDCSESLSVAVLTVSDTRTEADDTSGDYLAQALVEAGHRQADRRIVVDDIYQIRAVLSGWVADPDVHAVLVTGCTGFSGRDSTPEAVRTSLKPYVRAKPTKRLQKPLISPSER